MPLNMGGKGRGALALGNLELSRDMYGFAVRPQHLQRYREYAKIYKEEEEERSERWQNFLENYMDSTQSKEVNLLSDSEDVPKTDSVITEGNSIAPDRVPLEEHVEQDKENNIRQIRPEIKPSLDSIEQLLSFRIQKNKNQIIDNNDAGKPKKVPSVEEMKLSRFGSLVSEEDSEDEFYDVERSDPPQESLLNDNLINDSGAIANDSHASFVASCRWQQELESLVRGGLPMALRKKLWQAFVGTKARKMDNYYNDLLTIGNINGDECINDADEHNSKTNGDLGVEHIEKWKSQIEKDLPRTFPGHPALDEDGRSALRRLLTAYARHNPSVGYCQAMNFFAGLLLLLMPEENAFWTLTGIIDDYFDGYYSEKMVESQVDQLAFEELARELFPRLVSHFDKLGVQVAWVTGPWFLSIFVNVLPWETVLRVWDVLLYEGNRTMLFRTALALLELYGPALLTTKDAGDAVTLLQSLAGSTFDSSQLVLTACMGYQMVDENRLQELREKHRPTVLAIIDERSKDPRLWKRSQNLPTKLYNDCNKGESNVTDSGLEKEDNDSDQRSNLTSNGSYEQSDLDNLLSAIVEADNPNSMLDLQEQVKWLKNELCHALEEKRSAVLRAEELETALVEMVKEDNRRLLSAKLEEMESEVRNLQQTLAEKEEQERAMLEVMLRIEQEQKLTEDARLFAEQDAAAQRHAAYMLQEKYEDAVHQLALMEKRAIMAESMLDATLKSQALELKATKKVSDNPLGQEDLSSATESTAQRSVEIEGSPHNRISDVSQEQSPKKTSLLSRPFGLNWLDRNKVKTGSPDRQLLQSNSSDDLELKTDPAITENGTHLSQHSSNSVSDAD